MCVYIEMYYVCLCMAACMDVYALDTITAVAMLLCTLRCLAACVSGLAETQPMLVRICAVMATHR